MQAVQQRVESQGLLGAAGKWFYHNLGWFGAIGLAFWIGMGVNNGEATQGAVASVQSAYQGKVQYHVQHELALAKTAKGAVVACQHNRNVALDNDGTHVAACPPVPAK